MSTTLSVNITVVSLLISLISIVIASISITLLLQNRRSRSSLESNDVEVMALLDEFRAREKKLEEKLIDQKVKFEILELKFSRREPGTFNQPERPLVAEERPLPGYQFSEYDVRRRSEAELAKLSALNESAQPAVSPAVQTEAHFAGVNLEILRILEGDEKATAREIQQKINRSREHTSRTLNLLYREGLILRDEKTRPFSYSITDSGRKLLGV